MRLAHNGPSARLATIRQISLRLEHPSEDIRAAASKALEAVTNFANGHPASKPCGKVDLIVSVARRLDSSDAGVRKAALGALDRLNDGRAATDVTELPWEAVGPGPDGKAGFACRGWGGGEREGEDAYLRRLERGAPLGGPDHIQNSFLDAVRGCVPHREGNREEPS